MKLKTSLEITKELSEEIERAEIELKSVNLLKTQNKYIFTDYLEGYINGLKRSKNLIIINSKIE